MDWLSLGFGVGSIGLFASRAFVTTFVTALLIRFHPDLPFLPGLALPQPTGHEPAWITSDPALLILGVLALIELLAEKNADARLLLQQFDRYLKPAMAVLTLLGVMRATDQDFVTETLKQGGVLDALLVASVAIGTWFLATTRAALLELVDDADGGGEAGLGRLLSWLEDLWSVFGVLWLLVYPLAAGLLLSALSAALALWRWRAQRREARNRAGCPGCGALVHRSAMHCPGCGAEQAAPRAVGWLGTATERPADRARLPARLLEMHRCPRCAARLARREVSQTCVDCGRQIFADEASRRDYAACIAMRLPGVLLLGGAFSLIPVVGLIPGMLLVRLKLVAPFGRYLPASSRLVGKFALRLVFLVLVVLQVVPLLGAAAVPTMALLHFGYYRRAFLARADR